MQTAVKEIQERCAERGEEFPYDVNQTRQKFCRCVQACHSAALKKRKPQVSDAVKKPKIMGNGSTI